MVLLDPPRKLLSLLPDGCARDGGFVLGAMVRPCGALGVFVEPEVLPDGPVLGLPSWSTSSCRYLLSLEVGFIFKYPFHSYTSALENENGNGEEQLTFCNSALSYYGSACTQLGLLNGEASLYCSLHCDCHTWYTRLSTSYPISEMCIDPYLPDMGWVLMECTPPEREGLTARDGTWLQLRAESVVDATWMRHAVIPIEIMGLTARVGAATSLRLVLMRPKPTCGSLSQWTPLAAAFRSMKFQSPPAEKEDHCFLRGPHRSWATRHNPTQQECLGIACSHHTNISAACSPPSYIFWCSYSVATPPFYFLVMLVLVEMVYRLVGLLLINVISFAV